MLYRVSIDYSHDYDFLYWENAASFMEVLLNADTEHHEIKVKMVEAILKDAPELEALEADE